MTPAKIGTWVWVLCTYGGSGGDMLEAFATEEGAEKAALEYIRERWDSVRSGHEEPGDPECPEECPSTFAEADEWAEAAFDSFGSDTLRYEITQCQVQA